MEVVNRKCDFNLEDLEDAVKDTKSSFVINNKRVWMNWKPDFFQRLDQKLRRENYISEEVKCIVSVFLTNGELWPIDFAVKQHQFECSILIPTDDLEELNNKINLIGMKSYLMYPKEIIYNFRVKGCLIMFDYVKQDWVKQKEQQKQDRMEELKAAFEALTIKKE